MLALWIRSGGLPDRRPPEEAARKPRRTPVPLAGGTAIAAALATWLLTGGAFLVPQPRLAGFESGGLQLLGQTDQIPWLALTIAWALGLWDDWRGLGALAKFLGQGLVGCALIAAWQPTWPQALGILLAVWVALNVWNCWDHADGLASLPAAVFLLPIPGAWYGVLVFLPTNLLWKRGPERAPLAYLGDSGSHLLGLLLLLSPWAPWVLALPTLDFVRVSYLRHREGRAIWHGDRRHLGHRFEASGFSPATGAAWCTAAMLPGLSALGPWAWAGGLAWAGIALAFGLAVARTRDPGEGLGN